MKLSTNSKWFRIQSLGSTTINFWKNLKSSKSMMKNVQTVVFNFKTSVPINIGKDSAIIFFLNPNEFKTMYTQIQKVYVYSPLGFPITTQYLKLF